MNNKIHFFTDPNAEFDSEVWAAVGATPADALQTIMYHSEQGFIAHACGDSFADLCEWLNVEDIGIKQVSVLQQALDYKASIPAGGAHEGIVYYYLGDHTNRPLDPLWWGLSFFNSQQGAE